MEVITIDSEAYKAQEQRLNLLQSLFLQTVSELKEAKNERWMSVKEVVEYTGFSRDWVFDRKHDFGFFQDGKDLRFWKPDVMKYMELRSVSPKINRQLLKLKSRSA